MEPFPIRPCHTAHVWCGVHMNLLRNCELKFVCEVLKWQHFSIQIARKKSSLASLLNRSLKEIISSQNLTFLFLNLSDQESGKEDEQEWNEDPGPVVVNPFVANTSLVRDVQGYLTIKFFNLMFKDSNFDRIAEETNCYVRQAMVTKPDLAWCEIDTEKVKAFFALNILFGIKQLPEVHLYWSKNQLLGVPEVQKIFPRNQFAKISQYLHLNNKRRELPRGHANHNKLFKVQPLLDSVVEAIKSEYGLSKNISINEAMIPFKGRLSLKQCMPCPQSYSILGRQKSPCFC